jgi:hypothetical protein
MVVPAPGAIHVDVGVASAVHRELHRQPGPQGSIVKCLDVRLSHGTESLHIVRWRTYLLNSANGKSIKPIS